MLVDGTERLGDALLFHVVILHKYYLELCVNYVKVHDYKVLNFIF